MIARLTSVAALVCIVSLLAVPIVQAQGMPHAIIGIVTDQGGNPVAGATVTLTNSQSSKITVTTDSLGQYQADLSSMSGGYQVGEVIQVEANKGELGGSSTVRVTSAALDQCDISVGIIQSDSLWTFITPWIIVIGIDVGAVLGFLYTTKKLDGPKESGKGRRRR
jgi:hypothetical protein